MGPYRLTAGRVNPNSEVRCGVVASSAETEEFGLLIAVRRQRVCLQASFTRNLALRSFAPCVRPPGSTSRKGGILIDDYRALCCALGHGDFDEKAGTP